MLIASKNSQTKLYLEMQRTSWQQHSSAIAYDFLPRQILQPAKQICNTHLVLRLGTDFTESRWECLGVLRARETCRGYNVVFRLEVPSILRSQCSY
jgi:hypothetical protein